MAFSPYISDLEEEVAVETAIWRSPISSKRQQNSKTRPSAIAVLNLAPLHSKNVLAHAYVVEKMVNTILQHSKWNHVQAGALVSLKT